MKKILITGSFMFPDIDAAGSRVHSIAKLFDSQDQVTVVGWEKNEERLFKDDNITAFSSGDLAYDSNSNPLIKIVRSLFRGYKTLFWLKKNKGFDIILLYNPPAIFSLIIQMYCWINKIKLILDTTEWYEPKHLSNNPLSMARIENSMRMNFSYKFFKNTICISDFLDGYFNKHSIVIPPLFFKEVAPEQIQFPLNDEIRFMYAGQMGNKDKLEDFIYQLPLLSKSTGVKVKLTILGMSNSDLEKNLKNELKAKASIPFVSCLGRVPRDEMKNHYAQTHFVVFFRENLRYAIAGFPSKSIESWQHGRPIITNNVGELKKYLTENKNSLVLENTEEGLKELSNKLNFLLSKDIYSTMISGSRETFDKKFTTLAFKKKFNHFIANLS